MAKTIERLLAEGKAFKVDHMTCMQQASVLQTFKATADVHPWSGCPKEIQLGFKVAFIAICHQFNWDFLQSALYKHLLNSTKESLVGLLINVTAADLEVWLGAYPKKERIRAKERAAMLRDVGVNLEKNFSGSLKEFYEVCSRASMLNGEFSLVLDKFLAYRSDQLRKKTNVLAQDLYREKIIVFRDPENIEPAVDYHMMRLYLRSGRVVPTDESIYPFLKRAPKPRGTLVRALRAAVGEAEKLTALYAGLSIPDLNYIEWQIGRGICVNNSPKCRSVSNGDVPQDLRPLCPGQCPYADTCLSLNHLTSFLDFEEPNYVTTNY